ncbi:MAG: glycerol-3-phosphate acyltransferase [Anaerolineae bacterium]
MIAGTPLWRTIFWTVTAFIAGAIPFSVIVGRLALQTDIREYGDTNPGATNVLRAGSRMWALIAAFLDMFKAALPVAIAYVVTEIRDFSVVPIALAPLLGHLFSPFLRGRGGKGVAVTGGIWIGLTYGIATLVGIALMTLGYLIQSVPGWAVALGLAGIGAYLAIWRPDPILLTVWALNTAIVLWRHRRDLRQRPKFRSWLRH